MKTQHKVLLSVFLLGVVTASVAGVIFSYRLREEAKLGSLHQMQSILAQLEATATVVAEQSSFKDLAQRILNEYPDGEVPQDVKDRLLKRVPIVAAMNAGRMKAKELGYEFRVLTDKPRNQDNLATAKELEVMQKFKKDPELKEWVEDEGGILTLYSPVRLSEARGCLTCHGSPEKSPWKNGKDILGYPMEGWKDGDLRALFALSLSLKPAEARAKQSIVTGVLWLLPLVLLGVFLIYKIITRVMVHLATGAVKAHQESEKLQETSQSLVRMSETLSSAAVESAASIEETTASMEELSSMVRLSVEHGKKASELAEDIHHKAQGGAQKLQQLQQAMGEIQSGSEQVQSIVSLIEDIAFQTNLLALNAAVEAARAGEQGRGFAVVAEAVRALAQKSQVAAKDIAELIQANMRKVGAGGAVTEEAVTYFEEILQAIENLNTINKELATSFQEQARGLDNINQALGQIDQAVQQNAATSEEAKLVSQNVYQFSEQVKTSLDDLCRVVRESA